MEEPNFKVRAVDFEEKSLQEIETELVESHERSIIEDNKEVKRMTGVQAKNLVEDWLNEA